MTEKSEDQVVFICLKCNHVDSDLEKFHQNMSDSAYHPWECDGVPFSVVPHSKYLALQSDLALAVEALREIKECGSKTVPQTFPWYISRMIGIAKEALGKIGEKKSE